MEIEFDQPALLVLDVQKGFDEPYWGERNNKHAEEKIAFLLGEWRKKQWEVIHTQYLSLNPESPLYYKKEAGIQFKEGCEPLPDETVFQKHVNSAFIGTDLQKHLEEKKIQHVVITGLSTQHCVSTTTRMSGNLGFLTYLVCDATAAFELKDHIGYHFSAEEIFRAELAMLNKEFATILSAEELLSKITLVIKE
ncbi:cysteine hydrolase family protein [Fictibacillus fluitans]|uniref:Cysteine hydrolase family protein n=1 Tax=Fictibacillus fluitans TaxID=3058422 RepID=A0ABT8I3R3_9BACL|nr:cysteine hydrolase family protein [Fictibacillus sp. NE201]MDN4527685.1 cysteine hydrolase family protein [Fictibacillus sp. NE201]